MTFFRNDLKLDDNRAKVFTEVFNESIENQSNRTATEYKSVFKEDMKLTDLLKHISSSRKENYPHQNYLIIDLIKSLKTKPSDGFLYDVIINYIPFNFDLDFGENMQLEIHSLRSEYEKFPLLLSGKPIDIVFKIDENEWNGEKTLQLRMIDFRVSED